VPIARSIRKLDEKNVTSGRSRAKMRDYRNSLGSENNMSRCVLAMVPIRDPATPRVVQHGIDYWRPANSMSRALVSDAANVSRCPPPRPQFRAHGLTAACTTRCGVSHPPLPPGLPETTEEAVD
jgi:hypothetical protein